MIYFVDFEASSLAEGSYPIEVAWVDAEGRSEAHLIKPTAKWLDATWLWSLESQAVHGISRDTLIREGAGVADVAARAVSALSSGRVMAFSDAPYYDGVWMKALLAAGGQSAKIELLDVRKLYALACRRLLDPLASLEGSAWAKAEERARNLAAEIVARAEEAEAQRDGVRHRATEDAQALRRTWLSIQKTVARSLAPP